MEKREQLLDLYLIPTPLGSFNKDLVAPQTFQVVSSVQNYFVENAKTARAFLKNFDLPCPIQEISMFEISRKTSKRDVREFFKEVGSATSVGVLSEAGCPGVADPGAEVVAVAHQMGFRVLPLVGSSSILLGLMSSGLNGQNFSFHGYLPQDKSERKSVLLRLEKQSLRTGETIIFIETPYRSDQMLHAILATCAPQTLVCVASALETQEQDIRTMSVDAWSKAGRVIGKLPTLFLIQSPKR